jgi:hypothetical protein
VLPRAWTALAALAVVGGGLVASPGTPTGRPSAFATGFYCGPPLAQSTPGRFVQALGAGFTFSMPPCGDDTGYTVAQNMQILDAARAAGMPAVVMDSRMQEALDNPAARAQLLDAIVNSYSSHPALWGYFVYDEVPPELIGAVAAVVAGLRARDPRHSVYVSLFPDYYSAVPNYNRYLSDFVRQIRPPEIIYDYYPFLSDGSDRTGFFANLSAVRRAGLRFSTPFWFFAQLTELPGLRRASENEKRWQGLQTLAYGARGLMFFTYWSDVRPGFPEPGVIEPRTGLPTAHYPEVERVNAEVRAFGQVLASARSRRVFHNGPLAPAAVPRPPRASIYLPTRAPITIGLFDSARHSYALLANRNYRAPVSTTATLSFGSRLPERFDRASRRWIPVRPVGRHAHTVTLRLKLAPGAGALFRRRKPVPPGPPGAEAVFGRVRANVGHWHLVDSHGMTYELRGASWDECPSGFALVGAEFGPDGFWLCVRRDLASNRFYVGNVVHGSARFYRVRARRVRSIAAVPPFSCRRGSRLLGRLSGPDGFWLCLDRRATTLAPTH